MDVVWNVDNPFRDITGLPRRTNTLVAEHGLYTVGGNTGTVTRLDPDSGTREWVRELGDHIDRPETVQVMPDRSFLTAATDDETLHALDVSTGETRWTQSLDSTVEAVSLTDDSVVVAWSGESSDDASGVGCLAGEDGTWRWDQSKAALREATGYDPILPRTLSEPFDETVYVGTPNIGFRVRTTEGSVVGEAPSGTHRPLLGDDSIYIPGLDWVDAVTLSSFSHLWTAEPSESLSTGIALTDSGVYFGARDHGLYGIARETGDRLWRYEMESEVETTPAIAAGLVWTSERETDDRLVAVDAETGRPVGQFLVGGEVQAVTGSDDALYVFTSEQTYRLNPSSIE
ncbi:outer membrane protein assembly factor BamB family protein [Haloarchaeobius amylolyticus]|uniref:outer membrane protein assembly factor BamB family protein n=1 Tax=Haloarchaeobius amylolyticus TaxID=1198296 RepID=UPI002271339F|nr:PQQ-binding-like beta-propeller repeat protein [Haloarchaeobius amylolyticus]